VKDVPSDYYERLRSWSFLVLNRTMEVVPDRVSTPALVLRELGLTVREIDDEPIDAAPGEIVFVWGNPVWFPQAMRSLIRMPLGSRPATAIWFVEPLPPPRGSGYRWPLPGARELAKIALRDRRATDVYSNSAMLSRLARHGLPDVLAVISAERLMFLRERDIDAVAIPWGREPGDGSDLGLERDIDVLFLGEMRVPGRRRAVRRLRRAGIDVEAMGDYRDPSLWGEGRTRLINRAKVFLSVSRFPGTFTTRRFLYGMACGSLLVSDPLIDPSPFVAGTHYVETTIEDMPDVIRHYLDHAEERQQIARQGHDFVMQELTMKASVERLAGIIAERLGV